MSDGRIFGHLLMMLKAIAFMVIGAAALSDAANGQDQKKEQDGKVESGELGIGDPVLERLMQSKFEYRQGLEAVRMPIRDELQRRKEAAQDSGVLSKLEEATKDIEAFAANDKIPVLLMSAKPELVKEFRKGMELFQQHMIRGLEGAIEDYTRMDRLADATVIREKLKEYKATLRPPPPPRKPPRRRR